MPVWWLYAGAAIAVTGGALLAVGLGAPQTGQTISIGAACTAWCVTVVKRAELRLAALAEQAQSDIAELYALVDERFPDRGRDRGPGRPVNGYRPPTLCQMTHIDKPANLIDLVQPVHREAIRCRHYRRQKAHPRHDATTSVTPRRHAGPRHPGCGRPHPPRVQQSWQRCRCPRLRRVNVQLDL